MSSLKGKIAVITGSNRGIGRAVLELFAAEGANVFACARKEDSAFTQLTAGLAKEHAVSVTPVYFDLADEDAVKTGARKILAEKTPIDIVVNNAGIIDTAPAMMTKPESFREQFEVNFVGPMALTQILLRTMMRQRSGAIVNLSSSAAIEGNEGRGAYAVSKSALIVETKVMARELGRVGIRVNAIAPGLTVTDMMTSNHSDDVIAETLERVALRRAADPAEIAQAILFLASDQSSYMTGQVISVDGGM